MAEINVSGTWKIVLGDWAQINVTIFQDDQKLSGSFVVPGNTPQSGTLDGKIEGHNILINVAYSVENTGEFSGSFNMNGRLIGIVVYLPRGVSDTWASDKVFHL